MTINTTYEVWSESRPDLFLPVRLLQTVYTIEEARAVVEHWLPCKAYIIKLTKERLV